MSTLEEAANAFARDIMAMNMGGLMTVFTPEGMMKAMALQGQLMAQAQVAGQPLPQVVPGQPPPQAPPRIAPTAFDIQIEESQGEDHPVRLDFSNANGAGSFQSVWREIDGVWKVNDLALIRLESNE